MSILEENSDTQSQRQPSISVQNSSSEKSSAENLPLNIKVNQLNGDHTQSSTRLNEIPESNPNQNRRPSVLLQEILRRPSILNTFRRPSLLPIFHRSRRNTIQENEKLPEPAIESRLKNRRIGNDALSTALSALYAKILVIVGIALPITEILSFRLPTSFYQGFYVYLYSLSILFVIFIYVSHYRTKAVYSIINNYGEFAQAKIGKIQKSCLFEVLNLSA